MKKNQWVFAVGAITCFALGFAYATSQQSTSNTENAISVLSATTLALRGGDGTDPKSPSKPIETHQGGDGTDPKLK
jgi:hypothetical protein